MRSIFLLCLCFSSTVFAQSDLQLEFETRRTSNQETITTEDCLSRLDQQRDAMFKRVISEFIEAKIDGEITEHQIIGGIVKNPIGYDHLFKFDSGLICSVTTLRFVTGNGRFGTQVQPLEGCLDELGKKVRTKLRVARLYEWPVCTVN